MGGGLGANAEFPGAPCPPREAGGLLARLRGGGRGERVPQPLQREDARFPRGRRSSCAFGGGDAGTLRPGGGRAPERPMPPTGPRPRSSGRGVRACFCRPARGWGGGVPPAPVLAAPPLYRARSRPREVLAMLNWGSAARPPGCAQRAPRPRRGGGAGAGQCSSAATLRRQPGSLAPRLCRLRGRRGHPWPFPSGGGGPARSPLPLSLRGGGRVLESRS